METQNKIIKETGKAKKLVLLEKILRFMAIVILKKYQPKVIGITGSVGKTSAKEAIFTVLNGQVKVRKNEKNYNNEIGLPLTILGVKSGERSIIKWLEIFFYWLVIAIFPINYPDVLILEMGADHPGDIKYLASFIKCEMAVITDISGSHLEYFKTVNRVAKEKWELVKSLRKKRRAIVNLDNTQILKLVTKNQDQKKDNPKKINFLTFGFSEKADIKAEEVLYNYSEKIENIERVKGLSFKLNYQGTVIPVRLNNVLAKHNIYAALSGVAVGLEFKMNLVEIAKALENFSMPCGRMKPILGMNNTLIIDDSYNASPVSTKAALKVLGEIKSNRRIVVLGDMLELGVDTEVEHKLIAREFLKNKGDIFLAVGQRMKFATEELKRLNFSTEKIFTYKNPNEAIEKLQKIIQSGDVILVKGSQGMRMEKIVESIIKNPSDIKEILCRQDETWKSSDWEPV